MTAVPNENANIIRESLQPLLLASLRDAAFTNGQNRWCRCRSTTGSWLKLLQSKEKVDTIGLSCRYGYISSTLSRGHSLVNYFTHAVRYLDRPYFAAGVCVPDWLSVVDRKARVRGRRIDQELPNLAGDDREIATGIKQHLDDDRWFHGTAAFYEVTGQIARSFRDQLPESDSWRCGFLGHITMELLLDAALIEHQPECLNRYYDLLGEVDLEKIQDVVSSLATKEVTQLSRLIDLFVKERFIEDYLENQSLLFRLNQVMKRVQLQPLPDSTLVTLKYGREVVRANVHKLLPPDHFPERVVLPLQD